MSTKETGTGASDKKKLGPCMVCEEDADGYFFGANVCLPCKSFFVRTLNEESSSMKCSKNTNACVILGTTRSSCKYCRFQKCLKVGMTRKVRPEIVEAGLNQELCAVCQDIANGIHFGALTCEGCKKFFRRSLKEHGRYVCRYEKICTINPRTRNSCRYCRYQKCLRQGMSKDVKIGRPRKEMIQSLSSGENKMAQEKMSGEQSIETSPLILEEKSINYFPQSLKKEELMHNRPSKSQSSPGASTVIDLPSFVDVTQVQDDTVSHYDTTAMKHLADNMDYSHNMELEQSSSTTFNMMNIGEKDNASEIKQQEQSPQLMNMLLSSTDNSVMYEGSERAKSLVDQSVPLYEAHDPSSFQNINPSVLDLGNDMNIYSTLDHSEARDLNLKSQDKPDMGIFHAEKIGENINMLKHKLDYHMEKENVCSCKKLRKLAVENMDVPLHMKAMLMKRIESGDLKENQGVMKPSMIGKDSLNPLLHMSNVMGKDAGSVMQMNDEKCSPFSIMSSLMAMDSEKKLEILSKMMSSGDMMSKMMSSGDMMSKMMSSGDIMSKMMSSGDMMSKMTSGGDMSKKMSEGNMSNIMSSEDVSKMMSGGDMSEMMSSGDMTSKMMSRISSSDTMSSVTCDSDIMSNVTMTGGTTNIKSQMSDTNSVSTHNVKDKTNVPDIFKVQGSINLEGSINPEEYKVKTEPGIDSAEGGQGKDLFCFNNILEKFDRIKCPSCSNGYFLDQEWSNTNQEHETGETNSGQLGYNEQICFVHSPKSPEQLTSFSHIPPSNSNCVCLKDLLGTTGDLDNKSVPREGSVTLHDIHIKPVLMQNSKSPFTMMIEKMMDRRQITENKHKMIHPTPESCTDTVDRLRKLLKFFGIEEIQPKSNTRFESYVFSNEYWVNPKLPDENIMLDLKNKDMLEIVVSAYNHLITIMHEKVVSSKPIGDKPAQLPMDIVRKRTIRNLSHWITFIKTIPNFVNIDSGDQFTIVRLGGMMGIMLATALHQYDSEEHNFTNFYNFEFDPEHPHYHFRFALLDYGRDIQELQCDFVESAMMNACMAVALDYPDLEEPEIIEDIRNNLLEAFRAYTTAKYGTPNGRVEKIFAWIPRLRDLGMWNYKLSFSTCFSFEEAAGNSGSASMEKAN